MLGQKWQGGIKGQLNKKMGDKMKTEKCYDCGKKVDLKKCPECGRFFCDGCLDGV
jgi:hypothetical protein